MSKQNWEMKMKNLWFVEWGKVRKRKGNVKSWDERWTKCERWNVCDVIETTILNRMINIFIYNIHLGMPFLCPQMIERCNLFSSFLEIYIREIIIFRFSLSSLLLYLFLSVLLLLLMTSQNSYFILTLHHLIFVVYFLSIILRPTQEWVCSLFIPKNEKLKVCVRERERRLFLYIKNLFMISLHSYSVWWRHPIRYFFSYLIQTSLLTLWSSLLPCLYLSFGSLCFFLVFFSLFFFFFSFICFVPLCFSLTSPQTPLHIAAYHGHLDIVKFLFEKGADHSALTVCIKILQCVWERDKKVLG